MKKNLLFLTLTTLPFAINAAGGKASKTQQLLTAARARIEALKAAIKVADAKRKLNLNLNNI